MQDKDVTILYVEDDPANQKLVSKLLKSGGYQVLLADNGLNGIDLAREQRPDLILMDMNMPGLDGYEATTRIKSIDGIKSIPIVALTANTLDGDREKSLIAGCDGYIAKPIDVDSFLPQLKKYLEGEKETVDANRQAATMREYNHKLVERLEQKVRELTDINNNLEMVAKEKIQELQVTQQMLMQSEKMASVGQLAAGVAHEINNPIGYVNSNINTLNTHINRLVEIVGVYEQYESQLDSAGKLELDSHKKRLDINYIKGDVVELIKESEEGISRVKKIVQDLKDFSHVDEAEWQFADLHQAIDSTLNVANNEIKYKAEVIKNYGIIPQVECVISQINQVFMNVLINAAHAIKEHGTITISTGMDNEMVYILIEDTGSGISTDNLNKIFDPFFTTKPVGKGTGLGLSLSYGIIDKHGGKIEVSSQENNGTSFKILLPVRQ